MAKPIMIQGTMSNVGKSILTAGLCRVFKQDGFRVAPFKAQNMALNSFITCDGLEMGRAQAVQAEACFLEPDVNMNPILLKPVTDCGSQVIINGKVRGNMSAAEYFKMKRSLIPEVISAYNKLSDANDIIVIEGAGSSAEINLKRDDIVNMGMAKMVRSPVLLVGDIDPGGVFAQLAGTLMLLDDDERNMVKATVINKFRGDINILRPGLSMLEDITKKPVAGVVPMLDIDIDDEDSLSLRFKKHSKAILDVAIIKLPHISNFTDFSALDATEGVSVRYVKSPDEIQTPDLIVIPGTKNTFSDLLWLRGNGLESAIKSLSEKGTPVIGICGGYQMLGKSIIDPEGVECKGSLDGMGLLPVNTVFKAEKKRTLSSGRIIDDSGDELRLKGIKIEGYEIHMGETTLLEGGIQFIELSDGRKDGCVSRTVFGTYLHGFFDTAECRNALVSELCRRKGISAPPKGAMDYYSYRQSQYNKLADSLRSSLDMALIYKILEAGV